MPGTVEWLGNVCMSDGEWCEILLTTLTNRLRCDGGAMLRDVFRVVPRLCKLVVDRKVCLLCGGGGGVALVSRNGGQKLISKFVNFVNSLDLA